LLNHQLFSHQPPALLHRSSVFTFAPVLER
jgi:hypothetical protein